jgi:hypothetical protein
MRPYRLLVLCLLFLILPCAPLAKDLPPGPRNGVWWVKQNQDAQLQYLTGFVDGMELGRKFSYWGLEEDPKGEALMRWVSESYQSLFDQYVNGTGGEILHGMEKVYADDRNLRIEVGNAIWLVLYARSGKSEAEAQQMIERWRLNSRPVQ